MSVGSRDARGLRYLSESLDFSCVEVRLRRRVGLAIGRKCRCDSGSLPARQDGAPWRRVRLPVGAGRRRCVEDSYQG